MSDMTKAMDGQNTGMVDGVNGGRIMAPWNSETARAAARKRWDESEEAARRALAAAFGVPDWLAGVFELVYVQAGLAKDGGKGSTQAAAFVMRVAGLLRERAAHDGAGGAGPDGVQINIGSAEARELLTALADAMRERGTIIGSASVVGGDE